MRRVSATLRGRARPLGRAGTTTTTPVPGNQTGEGWGCGSQRPFHRPRSGGARGCRAGDGVQEGGVRRSAEASSRKNFPYFPRIQWATPTEPKPGCELLETRWRASLSVCTSLAIVAPPPSRPPTEVETHFTCRGARPRGRRELPG